MKKLVASLLVGLMAVAAVAAPAIGAPEKKTELVALGGASVEELQLRHAVDAVWVVDNQNLLYRDQHNAHYLVTMKDACRQLNVRSRSFDFFPGWVAQLKASNSYDVRPEAGPYCHVSRIEQLDKAKSDALRDKAQWRAW